VFPSVLCSNPFDRVIGCHFFAMEISFPAILFASSESFAAKCFLQKLVNEWAFFVFPARVAHFRRV
jgi:hypothetical protein